MVVRTSCRTLEAADASAWNFNVRTSSGTTCSANGMIKCIPSPNRLTVIIVTHNMQQAARVSDHTAFMYLGEMIEHNTTKKIFENPEKETYGALYIW